jgi:hypothetical protein
MERMDELSLLRVTDSSGAQMVVACVPESGSEFVSVGEPDSWTEHCRPVTSVLIDTTRILQLTSPSDVASLAAWLSAAAVWLREKELMNDD